MGLLDVRVAFLHGWKNRGDLPLAQFGVEGDRVLKGET